MATAAPTSQALRWVRGQPRCASRPCRKGSGCGTSFRARGSSSWVPREAIARSAQARDAALELVVSTNEIPAGVRVHLKLDTGMGRWGLSELEAPPFEVVGLMSHLATADTDAAYTEWQIDRFRSCDRRLHASDATHREQRGRASLSVVALRRGALRHRALRPLAVRHRSGGDGLEPVLSWTSHLAQVAPASRRREHRLRPPLHRRAATRGSGSFRSATRTASAATSPGRRCASQASCGRSSGRSRWMLLRSSSTASCPIGTPVVLIGRGMLAEDHARVADTITYELVCGISSDPDARAARRRRWLTIASREPRDQVAAHQDARAAELAERRASVRPARGRRARDRRRLRRGRARARARAARARGRRRRPRAGAAGARAGARARERRVRRGRRDGAAVRRRILRPRGTLRTLHHVHRPELVRRGARPRHPPGRPGARHRPARAGRPARGATPSTVSSAPATRATPACCPRSTSASSSRRTASSCSASVGTTSGGELGAYLDLAGCEGRGPRRGARPRAPGPEAYTATSGLVPPRAPVALADMASQPIQRGGAAPDSEGSDLLAAVTAALVRCSRPPRAERSRAQTARSSSPAARTSAGSTRTGRAAQRSSRARPTHPGRATGRRSPTRTRRLRDLGRRRTTARHPCRSAPERRRTQPTFSFNGDSVAYVKTGDIFTINSDTTGNEQQLTTHGRAEADPAYSPDGSKIAFARNDGAGPDYDLWIMTVDGRAASR